MVSVKRADVFLCDLNPVVGTEQAVIRPVVVLQTDRANAASSHTIIAPLTSKIRTALLPSRVVISAGTGGLQQESVLLCELNSHLIHFEESMCLIPYAVTFFEVMR